MGLITFDSQGALEVRDMLTGEIGRTIAPPLRVQGIYRVSADPGVSHVAAEAALESGSGAVVFDVDSGTSRLVGEGDVVHVSAGSDHLVIQRGDGKLEIWDVTGSDQQVVIEQDANFTPAETTTVTPPAVGEFFVAQRRSDGAIVIMDVTTGDTLGTLELTEESVQLKASLAFTDDGRDLVSAVETFAEDSNGMLVRWTLSPDAWMEAACSTVGRDLTADEWRRYVGTGRPEELDCIR
jgi:WD40 repeat protein